MRSLPLCSEDTERKSLPAGHLLPPPPNSPSRGADSLIPCLLFHPHLLPFWAMGEQEVPLTKHLVQISPPSCTHLGAQGQLLALALSNMGVVILTYLAGLLDGGQQDEVCEML